MCLFPKLIKNPKYRPNKKNGGNVPHMIDNRVGFVPIGCNMCYECRRKKALEWKVRLCEDIKEHENGSFVTLTFSDESFKELAEKTDKEGYELDNAVATKAMRLFLERWRKKYKKSLRHWLITELGHQGTENIHMHGIVFTRDLDEVEKIWKYGWIWKGRKKNGIMQNYVSERTINYMTKYVLKTDQKHKLYKPIVLCSAGIGKNYIDSEKARKNEYKEGGETKDSYTGTKGNQIALPIYYRNKLYSEEEREKLWLEKLDKNIRWIGGEKVPADNDKAIEGLLKYYQQQNHEMGYGSPQDWRAKSYEEERRKLKQRERIERAKEKEELKYDIDTSKFRKKNDGDNIPF